jgi:hypothetical protein
LDFRHIDQRVDYASMAKIVGVFLKRAGRLYVLMKCLM